MASSKEYLTFTIDQLSGLEEITYKAFLEELLTKMYDELPAPKVKKKGRNNSIRTI